VQERRESWDAIVVGASFGGLAAALALAGAGRVLMIDRSPIGTGQTSACATPLPVLERLDALEAVEQVHAHCAIHLPGAPAQGHPFPMRYPWATFDYAVFCRILFGRTGATFRQATVRGLTAGTRVVTTCGELEAPVIVDASGWRAVLAVPSRPPRRQSLGIELRLPGTGEGLHFWVQPEAIRHGYAWDFPAGGHRRVGIITYRESRRLRSRLDRFLGWPVPAAMLHGGALPARLRAPTAGSVFAVGDAAGQCLPLTGEGIRPALAYGWAAGSLARRVLAGDLPLAGALRDYRRVVLASGAGYTALAALQAGLGYVPRRAVAPLLWLFDNSPARWLGEQAYWATAPLELLAGAGRGLTMPFQPAPLDPIESEEDSRPPGRRKR
jgi:digeranylgeranylglycerophospholipid reductase